MPTDAHHHPSLFERMQAAFEKGDMDDTITWGYQVYNESPNSHSELQLAVTDQCLCVAYRTVGQYFSSIAYGVHALARVRLLDGESRLLGAVLRDLGRAHADFGAEMSPGLEKVLQLDTALNLYEESLEVFSKIPRPPLDEIAATKSFAALALLHSGTRSADAVLAVHDLKVADNVGYLVSAIIVALRVLDRKEKSDRKELFSLGRGLTVKGSGERYRRIQVNIAGLFGDRGYRFAMKMRRKLRR